MGWGLPASGGLKTFFPWKVAAGSLLSRELSVSLPPPAGALAVGCTLLGLILFAGLSMGLGWGGSARQGSFRQFWTPVSLQQALPPETSVCCLPGVG